MQEIRIELRMNVIVDIAIIPLGIGLSLSKYVAECEKIFKEAGLNQLCMQTELTLRVNGMMFLMLLKMSRTSP